MWGGFCFWCCCFFELHFYDYHMHYFLKDFLYNNKGKILKNPTLPSTTKTSFLCCSQQTKGQFQAEITVSGVLGILHLMAVTTDVCSFKMKVRSYPFSFRTCQWFSFTEKAQFPIVPTGFYMICPYFYNSACISSSSLFILPQPSGLFAVPCTP